MKQWFGAKPKHTHIYTHTQDWVLCIVNLSIYMTHIFHIFDASEEITLSSVFQTRALACPLELLKYLLPYSWFDCLLMSAGYPRVPSKMDTVSVLALFFFFFSPLRKTPCQCVCVWVAAWLACTPLAPEGSVDPHLYALYHCARGCWVLLLSWRQTASFVPVGPVPVCKALRVQFH